MILENFSDANIFVPYRNPKVDLLAKGLWEHKDFLARLVFFYDVYSCFFPVFVEGKIIKPSEFVGFGKNLREIAKSITKARPDIVYTDVELKTCLPLAILKLKGGVFTND